jgi:hypothetical protein
MAAFSSFHFSDPGARPQRAPATCIPCATPHRHTDLEEIATRLRTAAKNVALLLWAMLALGFSLLVMADFFLG